MKLLPVLVTFLISLSTVHCWPKDHIELDDQVNDTEDEFLENFHLPEITDPEEKARRAAALQEAEDLVKAENQGALDGNNTWTDALNEFSDLPEDEFEAQKTGLVESTERFGRGLIMPTGPIEADVPSEAYFAGFRSSMRSNRASVPRSYSAVDQGLVSPVKNQKQCGSCVAFATMAAIESCFKWETGVFGDYSEQQLVDCGYGGYGNGCNGAPLNAYFKWASDSKADLTAEANYPYKNQNPTLTCPNNLDHYNQGAKVSGAYTTYSGDEETLKGLVAAKGAVVSGVAAAGPFQQYNSGIFAGCTSSQPDHAITVVGYGTENGVDYWLIKNSWGTGWGENGFIRMKRGVGMCGIGKTIVTVDCEKVAGPTDATITTKAPCEDKWSNCPSLATKYCYMDYYRTNCAKSCGSCPGLTPAASTTCWDKYNNCASLCSWIPDDCKKSCGGC